MVYADIFISSFSIYETANEVYLHFKVSILKKYESLFSCAMHYLFGVSRAAYERERSRPRPPAEEWHLRIRRKEHGPVSDAAGAYVRRLEECWRAMPRLQREEADVRHVLAAVRDHHDYRCPACALTHLAVGRHEYVRFYAVAVLPVSCDGLRPCVPPELVYDVPRAVDAPRVFPGAVWHAASLPGLIRRQPKHGKGDFHCRRYRVKWDKRIQKSSGTSEENCVASPIYEGGFVLRFSPRNAFHPEAAI